jgi:hypothetical protein
MFAEAAAKKPNEVIVVFILADSKMVGQLLDRVER